MLGAIVFSVYASFRNPKMGANASRSSISASSTCFPARAAAIASAAATVVFPTPPLPETTATRAVVQEGAIADMIEAFCPGAQARKRTHYTLDMMRGCAPDLHALPPCGPLRGPRF